MTIKEQLIALGVPESEIDNHSSDLYVLKTPLSEKFVAGYEFKQNVTTFTSQIDRKVWYEIPFAYSEHYAERKKPWQPMSKQDEANERDWGYGE